MIKRGFSPSPSPSPSPAPNPGPAQPMPPAPPIQDTPKTVANWIPVAIPPKVEKTYLIWVRQGGSVLAGIIATSVYYPFVKRWEITEDLGEGEQVDLWADVLSPFWYAAPEPGSPPTNPTTPS